MTFFSTSQKLEIGDVPFISHLEKPTRRESLEYYRRVYESWDLNVQLYTLVKGIKGKHGDFQIETNHEAVYAKTIIVATGFYGKPKLMNIPGEDLPKVYHYYKEVHPFIGQKVAVIGAANSACDVAMELYHKGAEVTMIVRQSELSPRVKYWIKPNIENRIKEGSIKAFFDSNVIEIKPDSIAIRTPEGLQNIPNDFVLAMTGYTPDFDFLSTIGISLSDDEVMAPIHNAETLETNRKGLYVAGVINAGMHTSKIFIENSMDHAVRIVDHIDQNISNYA